MKRILIVCLIGMGLLLPTTNLTAKNFLANLSNNSSGIHTPLAERCSRRAVNVLIDNEVLSVTSDASTGTLIWIKIYNDSKALVQSNWISGYSDAVSVSGLESGAYSCTIHTTVGNYSANFYKN